MQLVDVSGDAGRIDSGNIFAQIGGNFGGYLSEHDSMTMTVRFLDENGDPIGDPVDVGGDQSRGGFTVIYQNVAFVNIPQGTRSFEVVLSADHETGSYTDGYADNLFITLSERVTESIAINLTPVDDAGVPQSDQFTTDELTAIINGNLFADNGSGTDVDPDGTPVISAVNGLSANVGSQLALASGALLTVNANGTFSYHPNGAFEYVAAGAVGTDSFTYTLTGGNSATVTIKLTGIDNDDVIIGTGAGDTLRGGVGDDQIFGLGGNDLIFGDSGNDTMSGGLGNDRFIVDSASDVVIEAFGEGEDTLSTSVSYTLGAGVYVEIVGTTNNNATTALSLTGNEFDNQIWANAGNNILNGAAGADYMAGYAGNDTYIIDNAADAIRELSGEGNDVARTSVSYRLGTRVHVETLETTDASGTAALRLTGNELANTIIGNAGANIIDGGEGADTLNGGSGNDRYFVDDVGDVIVESLTGGEDMVSARVSYVLNAGAYVEVLGTVSNSATTAINLTGNELANSIQGNQGINVLSGMAGGDYLVGLGGDDVLMGGLGVDNLSGGAGADRFVYENANESTSEARDRILDFDSADVIDLSAIDADLNSAGDQQFTFVGTAGFSRTAGELRVIADGAGTYVVDADIDGNGTADLSITVNYASVLNAGDFWL